MAQDADLFIAASLTWFHGDSQYVTQILEQALSNTQPNLGIEWRTDVVRDFRPMDVPASAERLIRWDNRHPDEVFQNGFVPQYAPARREDLQVGDYANLDRYVNQNVPSVFVSTARYYRQDNRCTRWTPRGLANRFEYEIFAYGGIDVNLSLDSSNRFFNQREIAFPGGIRSEYIRTAREYDGNGAVVRMWVNGGFDIMANGPRHSARAFLIPDPVCGPRVLVRIWGSDRDEQHDHHDRDHDELRRRRDHDELRRRRDTTNTQDDVMSEPGDPVADPFMDDGNIVLPMKFISGDDAPEQDHIYAISLFGTTKVLTCINSTELGLGNWLEKSTQRFRCVTYEGHMGFICEGADGDSGRYLGYDSSETLACEAYYQRGWEHIHARADHAGGFYLWMIKNAGLAPIKQVSETKFKMMATSATRFCFTRLDTPEAPISSPPDFWGVYPAGTDSPVEGNCYAIKIYGTSKAFTCVDGTKMRLREWWIDDKTQHFRCTLYDGHMGFICEGADRGKGRYLGFDSSETLACEAYYQRGWEHIYVRADPAGGFMLWMNKDSHLAPVSQVNADTMKMMATSSTRVSFTRLR